MEYLSKIKVGEKVYNVEYEVSRKLVSSVRIKKGRVVLKLSRFLFGAKREETVEKFLIWAKKKLSKISGTNFVVPLYKDGGRVLAHNKAYEISVFFSKRKNVRTQMFDGYLIKVFLPESYRDKKISFVVKDLVESAIIKDQTAYLKEVVAELNDLYFQEKYNLCRFKKMNSRFGSLSNKRNVNIAFRLLFAPREVFRYVCAHELAHLKEFNHSKRFWAIVAEAMPNYKEHEKWLKNNGFLLG